MLVISRTGDARHAAFGGLLALAAKQRGIAGAVLDGPATDLAEIAELRFPVFARGISALTTRRLNIGGTVGEPITCGGVRVATGDYVLGDDDGVLIIPALAIGSFNMLGDALRDAFDPRLRQLARRRAADFSGERIGPLKQQGA